MFFLFLIGARRFLSAFSNGYIVKRIHPLWGYNFIATKAINEILDEV